MPRSAQAVPYAHVARSTNLSPWPRVSDPQNRDSMRSRLTEKNDAMLVGKSRTLKDLKTLQACAGWKQTSKRNRTYTEGWVGSDTLHSLELQAGELWTPSENAACETPIPVCAWWCSVDGRESWQDVFGAKPETSVSAICSTAQTWSTSCSPSWIAEAESRPAGILRLAFLHRYFVLSLSCVVKFTISGCAYGVYNR